MYQATHSGTGAALPAALALALALLAAPARAASDAPTDAPAPEVVSEARAIVTRMTEDRRGPYAGIRWFCEDGAVLPPQPYACRERGGGRQHAIYSEDRARLAALGWHVGTIFAATPPEALLADDARHRRLRELPLERFLRDVDDGWVMRRARSYRGHVQVEGEARAGRALLEAVLGDTDLASANFLLARELARVVPHGEDTDLARRVRRDAVSLAELDPRAEALRAEIHSSPGPDVSARLRRWAETDAGAAARTAGLQLAEDLDALYGAAGRRTRLETALARLPAGAWPSAVRGALDAAPSARIAGLCERLAEARTSLFPRLSAPARVDLLDAMQGLETEVLVAFGSLDATRLTRAELLALAGDLVACGQGAGLLSAGEARTLTSGPAVDGGTLPLEDWRDRVQPLRRAPGWAGATVRHAFAEPLVRYTALDPRAARFVDDLLRESPLRPLGTLIELLARDLGRLDGTLAEIAGEPAATALALNGGLATGRLRVLDSLDALGQVRLAREDIVVIPETIAELSPVAGILTLGEGNALSHVQLLARNFGIPNVAVDGAIVDRLRPLEGREVLLVVDSRGNVVLREVDEEIRGLLLRDAARRPSERVRVPEPDLDRSEPLPLGALRREISGVLVGPKAANLGELARLFPGRVAPAVAVPFGVYAGHLEEADLLGRIGRAFAARTDGTLSAEAFDAELAAIRRAVQALRLSETVRDQLDAAMAATFDPRLGTGVFVRSDTNVEDLPQFTGAGLNETLANVVGREAMYTGVTRVWGSVLSPRAIAWRADVLENPARIFASVLLMQSVPATKSGVLVTTNLVDRSAPGATASVAWGVGGAVSGEAAETLVIGPERIERIAEAKTPWQRRLAPGGGIDWVPAPAGPVLTAAEIDALRALADEAVERYAPVFDDSGRPRPLDIEFGFVDGELTLFQIRPLVERGNLRADRVLAGLRGPGDDVTAVDRVDLDAVPSEAGP